MGLDVSAPPLKRARGQTPLKEWTRQGEHLPAGRIAAVVVIVSWVIIALAVLVRWVPYDAAAFVAAAVFTLAITSVVVFDAALDWADPDEGGSLAARLRPERAWPQLEHITGLLRVAAVPVCFVGGTVLGHFLWH